MELKDTLEKLWHNKAFLIVLIVVVLVGGYILIKNKNSTVVAPNANSASGYQYGQVQGQGPGYYLQEDTIINPTPNVTVQNTQTVQSPVSVTQPTGATQPPKTITKTVQKPYTTQGVTQYILGQPNKGRSLVDQIEKQQRAQNTAKNNATLKKRLASPMRV